MRVSYSESPPDVIRGSERRSAACYRNYLMDKKRLWQISTALAGKQSLEVLPLVVYRFFFTVRSLISNRLISMVHIRWSAYVRRYENQFQKGIESEPCEWWL